MKLARELRIYFLTINLMEPSNCQYHLVFRPVCSTGQGIVINATFPEKIHSNVWDKVNKF